LWLMSNCLSFQEGAHRHEVTEAENGSAGLARLAERPVGLGDHGLGMPEMTGWEVAQQLEAAHPDLSVILLTGWGQDAKDAPADRARVDRVLAKPIRLEELQG